MKKTLIIAAVLVLASVAACRKDEVRQESGPAAKVQMTFTASFEAESPSKVAVGVIDEEAKTLKLTWNAGDKIAVYDGISSEANLFTADADGATTTFSGSVSDGATQFIAVYPYDLSVSMDAATGAGEAFIPETQQAVAGSFDPDALAMVGSADSENPNIRFRLFGSLLSFSVDFDDIVAVQFSGSRPMSGNFTYLNAVGASGPTSISTINEKSFKDVVLKAAEGETLQKGETYYVYVRNTGSNSHDPFVAKLVASDGRVASREGANPLQLARKTMYPLGTFNSDNCSFGYDRYATYMAGFDVEIAGVTYNKNDAGAPAATLLEDGGVFKTGMSGLVFVASAASVTNSSEVTIDSDVVITSNDLDNPGTYASTASKSLLLKSGSLTMDNLIVDLANTISGQFMSKKDLDTDFTSLVLNRCDFRNISRYVSSPNSTALLKGIGTIKADGCRFGVSAATPLFFINSGVKTLAGYHDFIFTNNVVYSTTGNGLGAQIFSTTSAIVEDTEFPQSVTIENNLFYNIATDGIYRTYYFGSINISKNILWAKEGTDPGSNIKLLRLNVTTADAPFVFTGSSSDNYCYGTLATGRSWTICDTKYRGPLTNVSVIDTDPVASFDEATGIFTLTDAYKTFGPQVQP